MPRPRWASPEQWVWLEKKTPSFADAQQQNTTAQWWPVTYTEWFAKWPLPKPGAADIAKAGGSISDARDYLLSKKKTVSPSVPSNSNETHLLNSKSTGGGITTHA